MQPMSAGGEIKTRLYEAIDISGAGTKEVLAQLVLSGISWPGRPMSGGGVKADHACLLLTNFFLNELLRYLNRLKNMEM